jgi:methylated-DNA-[protein]-cysteine S-methyltransferase
MLRALEYWLRSGHVCAMSAPTATASFRTPIGLIALKAEDDVLIGGHIDPVGGEAISSKGHALLSEALDQLRAWFARERRDFDLPLRPLPTVRGNELRAGIAAIPYGETRTYGGLAQEIFSAPRAVGQACRRNIFPIIIPCHRVISSAGPEYYSGGEGAITKAWLIDFEKGQTPWKRTQLL